ncbi:hypothetical protein TWF694_002640 [Orbilia ellipsospora]|uniref:Uncharacterized protein n=1 Tax=Orbilia ellipsospora TaxID=2528407 RepID=A0AAV9X2J5_9PEZI
MPNLYHQRNPYLTAGMMAPRPVFGPAVHFITTNRQYNEITHQKGAFAGTLLSVIFVRQYSCESISGGCADLTFNLFNRIAEKYKAMKGYENIVFGVVDPGLIVEGGEFEWIGEGEEGAFVEYYVTGKGMIRRIGYPHRVGLESGVSGTVGKLKGWYNKVVQKKEEEVPLVDHWYHPDGCEFRY